MTFVDLHDRAMALVDEARERERAGDGKGRVRLLREAYQLEERAARLLEPTPASEPTRSVLFRSASSLAFQAEDYREACNLAFDGLTGNSPEEYASELLDIANDAKFRLRLIDQKLRVVKSEITLIVRGPRVAIGLAPAKQTTLMLRRIENLLRSRVEDFLKRGIGAGEFDWPTEAPKLFEVFIRPLATEEFAVAFRLGLNEQLHLFGSVSLGDRIVGEFMNDLRAAVYEDAPATNQGKFAKGVFKLEPDGKEVTSIEINSLVSGELISVRIPPKKHPEKERLFSEARLKPSGG
jgi:hypothetical protein